jgi:hypothetical protein
MKTRRVLCALAAGVILASLWACNKTTYDDRVSRFYYDQPVQQSRDVMPSRQKAEAPPAQPVPTPAPAPKAEAPKTEAPAKTETPPKPAETK